MRTPLSKSLRFEVFKRDSFTCQYCGRKAPDVLLHVDHIDPVANGGSNEFLNLITACQDCNSGKSDKLLSETTILDKQRQQLEDLQERREQIDLMFQWQQGLSDLQNDTIDRLSTIWTECVSGYALNEDGIRSLKRLVKTYSIDEIISAMRKSADQYVKFASGVPIAQSVEAAWSKVGGICRLSRIESDNPNLKRLYYIRGILRNRLSYCNEAVAIKLLQDAFALNASVESLERFAKEARNWTQWRDGLQSFISKQTDTRAGNDHT